MGAQSAGWSPRPPEEQSGNLAQLLAARQSVCQSLEKSRELDHLLQESNKRLQGFQDRLSPVRRALTPLQEQSKIVEGLSHRIDKALEPATSVLKMFHVLHKLRPSLMHEPREDFDGYLAALMQLEEAADYLKHNSSVAVRCLQEAMKFLEETGSTDSYRTRRLNESLTTLKAQQTGGTSELDGGLLGLAQGKLEKEFKSLLAEHSRPMTLPAEMAPQVEDGCSTSSELENLVSYPPEVLQKLQAIVAKLAGSEQYQRCVDAYQETRSAQCRESLQAIDISYLQNSTPELVNQVPWDDLQNMIQLWTRQLEVVVKVLYAGERRLARQVFRDVGQPVWVECLSNLAKPGIYAFMQFGESISKSSRSPEKLCKLLDMFESMEKCEHSVIQVFDGQACHEIRSQYRELLKQVVYGALRTFWDIRVWVEEQKEPHTSDGNVMKLCSYVVNFLKYLVREFLKPINKVLRIEHSWRGGEGPQERGLAYGILQFLQALERQVEARSKAYQDPALRHIFMMNNLYYIRNRVKKCDLGPLLGDSWISDLGRKVEQHALKYQREGWQRVLAHLSREGLLVSSGGRAAARELVRQRLRGFFAAFDEAIQTQSKWVIQEEDLRDVTLAAVTQTIVPAYRSYLQSFGPLLEGHLHSATKYIKYTPEAVEQMLGDLFTPARHQNGTNGHDNEL